MPKYFYVCTSCETKASFYHAMDEEEKNCPRCKLEDSLQKIPSFFSFKQNEEENKETGQIVKESIEEFKEDLEKQKNNLKNELYKTNE